MGTYTGHIMTLANSIIGVSILAMPFCFKECGIILSILMLLVSSIVSRLACHFLMKSAILTKRRTFELLAFHLFGLNGKFMVELGIIGFLMGTCIAFFVVIGDLAPAIFVKLLGLTSSTATIRSTLLISIAIFCILPLGLLKNVDSLTSVCAATIGFYFCLVLKIITESLPHMVTGDWVHKVELWKPAGVLQCLPIFSMALCCQTQLFEMYDTLPNASLEKMNSVVRNAVNICTAVYIFIGFFGYVAFCSQPFTGNILMSFTPSIVTDVMKMGFVLSLACSFPLVIFPCRASLFSLLKRVQTLHDVSLYHIPENWFKWLTIMIVGISLVIGLLIPSIELVLGLVGSTIGVMICILFPTSCFICVFTKNTNERLLAQIMFIIGLVMMVLGTYTNLYAIEYSGNTPTVPPAIKENVVNEFEFLLKPEEIKNAEIVKKWENMINDRPIETEIKNKQNDQSYLKLNHKKEAKISSVNIIKNDPPRNDKTVMELPESIPVTKNIMDNDIRQEPPQPVESEDIPGVKKEVNVQSQIDSAKVNDIPRIKSEAQHNKLNSSSIDLIKNRNGLNNIEVLKNINDDKEIKTGMNQLNDNKVSSVKRFEGDQLKQNSFKNVQIKSESILEKENLGDILKQSSSDNINKHQETQIKEKTTESGRELLNEIKKQVNEAKQVLEEIKEQKKELDRKQELNEIEKKKAVEQIKKIADIAIHSLNTENGNKKSDEDYLKKGDDLILKLIPEQTINKFLQKVDVEKSNAVVNKSEEVKAQEKNDTALRKDENHIQADKVDKVSPQLSNILSNMSGNLNFKNSQYSAPIPVMKANNMEKDILDKNKKDQSVLSKDKFVNLKVNNNNINNVRDEQALDKEKPVEHKEKQLEQDKSQDAADVPKQENKNNKLNSDEDFKKDIKNMRRDILSNLNPNEHQEREKRDVRVKPIREQQTVEDLNENCEKRERVTHEKHKVVSSRKQDGNEILSETKLEKTSTRLPELKSLLEIGDKQLLNLNIVSLKHSLEHTITLNRDIKTLSNYLKKIQQT